ncbi:FAD-dependent monooxygenase [bacterium]|nr:FAD-dependent monooxygenase [bacterium]
MAIKDLQVGVVGASIAGLMAAHALAQRGARVELFERSLHLGERGSGVMLESRVASSIGGLCSRAYSQRLVLGSQLQACWSRPLSKMACSWGELYRCLRARVPDSAIHAGLAVLDCSRDGEICFSDGSRRQFEVVVGADGLGSTVRGCMGQDFQPTYCGYVAMRGMIEADRLPGSARDLWQAARNGSLLNLYGRRTHAIVYAPPGASNSLINWMWYCNVNDLEALFTDAQGQLHRWSLPPDHVRPELRRSLLEQARAALPGPMVDMMEATEGPYLQAICQGVPELFGAGKIALVGDAAHVSPPHLGAATSIAYQDIHTLVDALCSGQSLHDWGQQRRQAVLSDVQIAYALGQALQFGDYAWDDWESRDFEEWWETMTEGQRLYFDR